MAHICATMRRHYRNARINVESIDKHRKHNTHSAVCEEDANPCEDGHEVMINECWALTIDEGRAPNKDPHKLEQRFQSLLKEKANDQRKRAYN